MAEKRSVLEGEGTGIAEGMAGELLMSSHGFSHRGI
jgi:hypothetical protein